MATKGLINGFYGGLSRRRYDCGSRNNVCLLGGINVKEIGISTRNIRKRNIALVKDLVKVKIIGKLNGAIHATLNGPELGVLFTKCRKCGKNVKPLRDIIKCTECGWTDERKLSSDFLKSDFVKVRE